MTRNPYKKEIVTLTLFPYLKYEFFIDIMKKSYSKGCYQL